MASFVEKVISKEGGTVRLICAVENNQPVWFYIKLFPDQYQAYKQAIKKQSANDIRQYGEILYAGVGKEPPMIMQSLVKERYGS